MTNWKSFFFESNQFFDTISGMKDWQRLRNAHPDKTDEDLLSAKAATYGGKVSAERLEARPKYGFRWECDGEPLSEFFKRHNMKLLPVGEGDWEEEGF